MILHCLLFVIISSHSEATLRILGGRDALKDEFPFAIRLETHSADTSETVYQFCTGAAITTTWVLSAAHCYEPVRDALPESNKKPYARYNSYFPEHQGQLAPILDYYIHPGFNVDVLSDVKSLLHDIIQNDVALFRCGRISVSVYAKISAVNYRTIVGHEATVLGFGYTNASEADKPLQVLKGMLINCLEGDAPTKLMMCLVPPCGLVATICGGDSGGPILHSTGVVGVNSMSVDTCNEYTKYLKRTPGTSASIIAMLSPHVNWITNIITNKTSSSP